MYKYIPLLLIPLLLAACTSVEVEKQEPRDIVSFEVREDAVLFEVNDIHTAVDTDELFFQEGDSLQLKPTTLITENGLLVSQKDIFIMTVPKNKLKDFSHEYVTATKESMKFIEFNENKAGYKIIEY